MADRDRDEIKEILECDADTETKCRMVLNVVNGKPHYFKEPKTDISEQALDGNNIYIPKNATNGDVWLKVFGGHVIEYTQQKAIIKNGKIERMFNLTWWNAPYQKVKIKNEDRKKLNAVIK